MNTEKATVTSTLFTEQKPTAYGYARHAEDEFSYMNTHSDTPVLAAREMLEGWYKYYPTPHRVDLVRRFRSKNHKQHDGAFWELYLHELFRRMGYEVQVHPQLDGIETRPDFLLTQNGAAVAFVEARLAGLHTDLMSSAERLKNELHDALDTVQSPNFFLDVEEVRTAPARPSFKNLKRRVEQWLKTLNPDLPIQAFLDDRNPNTQFEWEHSGWYVSLKAIPRGRQRGSSIGRSVGVMGGDFQWVDTKAELRRALGDKASKYGKLDLPFIIAINYVGTHCDREDWIDALYGSQATKVWFDERGAHHQEPFRKNDGFWISKGLPRRSQISAIMGAFAINTWSMGAHHVEVYQHFRPDHPIHLNGNLPCWYVPSGQDKLALLSGRSSAEILEIPEHWPGKWDHDRN